MRVLIIALQHTVEGPASPEEQRRWGEIGSPMRTARLEEDHALALATTMRDGGSMAPMLLCLKGSHLHNRALELNLPVLAVGGTGAGNPLTLLRLWRWQRRHKFLLVQTIGETAMALGHRVLSLRPATATLLCHAFLHRPPHADVCTSKTMLAAHRILCGTEHARARITEGRPMTDGRNADTWPGPKNRALPLPGDALPIVAPGMNTENYEAATAHARPPLMPQALPNTEAMPEHRFVFCMGDALAPRSGTHLVVRAMAALWQREDLPPWEVRAVGGGPRFQEVLDEAEGLGVASRLSLLNEQNLADVLASCHAWIAPGSSPDEVPEALGAGFAARLPVICSQSPLHMQRLTRAPHAACMVAEDDSQALAKAMIDIMTDAELRRSLIKNAETLRPQLGLDAFAANVCRLYETWCGQLGWLTAEKATSGPKASPPDATGA
jgi:glycosyltransferase involved in cell wall biosynthesis